MGREGLAGSVAKERHVERFVFGALLPVRGVDHVWERRYGFHWIVERKLAPMHWSTFHVVFAVNPQWKVAEWLHPKRLLLCRDNTPPPP